MIMHRFKSARMEVITGQLFGKIVLHLKVEIGNTGNLISLPLLPEALKFRLDGDWDQPTVVGSTVVGILMMSLLAMPLNVNPLHQHQSQQ